MDGDAERGIDELGEREPDDGIPVSGGLRVFMDGPRRGGMAGKEGYSEWTEVSRARRF